MGTTGDPSIDDVDGTSLADVLGELEARGPGIAATPAPVPARDADDDIWVIESSADDLSALLEALPEGTVLLREGAGA